MASESTLRERLFARIMSGADATSHAAYSARKVELLGPLRGVVVEIGAGTGVNLAFLDHSVHWIGVEPNAAMHEHIRNKAAVAHRDVEIRNEPLHRAGFAAHSVDAVISTLVLCSVPSVADLLAEVRRILRPGGKFVFIEHVADRRWTFRRVVQHIAPFTPWRYFSDGCDPGRDIASDIRAAGFADVSLEAYMQAAPGLIAAVTRPHIAGVAVK